MDYIAQSVIAQSPAAAGLDLSSEIIVHMCDPGISQYEGRRATLEAEGVIPAGTKWPEGFGDLHWNDERFSYWLRRIRPQGAKGPRKAFINVDWWMFRITPHHQEPYFLKLVRRKQKEIDEIVFKQSAKGRAQAERFWQSFEDARFQAFKALIPGLVPAKRERKVRKPKSSNNAV